MGIVIFKELKESFNKELERTINYSALIESEIDAIDNFIKSPKYTVDIIGKDIRPVYADNSGLHVFQIKTHVKNRFSEHFREFYLYGTHKDSYFALSTEENKKDVLQAKELVDYYKWLIDLRDKPIKPKEGPILKNYEQRLLALKYLGFDVSQNHKNKIAMVLSEILGIGDENIRRNLSSMHSGPNGIIKKENLNTVKNLLELYNFKSAIEKINKDLSKLG